MNWTVPLVALLRADFGGFPTFCYDPDHILDIPEAREALRGIGMRISEWSGHLEGLGEWENLDSEDKPIVAVHASELQRYIVARIPSTRWQPIGVQDLFPAFAPEVVRQLPVELWDAVAALSPTGSSLNPSESLERLARGLYGLDPLSLRFGDGWWKAWLEVASDNEGWPVPIARWAASVAPSPLLAFDELGQTLLSPDAARDHLRAVLRERPPVWEQLSPFLKSSIESFGDHPQPVVAFPQVEAPEAQTPPRKALTFDLNEELSPSRSPTLVLDFSLRFLFDISNQTLETQDKADELFAIWLRHQYALMLSSSNSSVLCLPKLVARLDEETGSAPLLLAVVDSLGLRAWKVVREVWRDAGVFSSSVERCAFAVLPTITSFSRRALFEGKLPAFFKPQRHSQSLEKSLWKERFGKSGDYFAPVEHLGIQDAFATQRSRVAVVDVQ